MVTSKFDIKNYVIYGNDNYSLPSYFVNVEYIEKTIASFDGHIKPHVHSNLFQIIYIKEGKGYFKTDQTHIEINGSCIITVPENTLHEIRFEEGKTFKGKVVTMATNLLENLLADLPNGLIKLTTTFNHIDSIDDYSTNNELIKKINAHLPVNGPRARIAINAHLSLLILNLIGYDKISTATHKKIKKQSYVYFRKFEQSVKESYSICKSVSEYADELRITPTHLNRICKANVGLTASQVIQNFIVLEAKRNLNHTSHTISEISHILNFKDLGYFCRFFKKHTGKTPKEFRNIQLTMQS